MGDRANVVVQDGQFGEVFLYTHWSGSELPQLVQTALRRNQRWDDASYLARIVFCEMLDDLKGETGFGISAHIGDNTIGRPLIVLDARNQMLRFESEDRKTVVQSFTFADYCKLKNPDYPPRR